MTAALKNSSASLHLQDRDLALLRGLFESRVLTIAHAAQLYFDGKSQYTKKRLQKIKSAGFVGERTRRVFEPSVLFLTRKGLLLLQERGILAEYPPFALPALVRRARVSDLTIRHELDVLDVKTAFHGSIKKTTSFTIAEFSTWPMLNEFRSHHPTNGSNISVKPDGFIRFHEKTDDGSLFEHTFFIEVDRSNEIQEILITRAACYFDYYKSGGFAIRNGVTRSDYKEFPFRVLMVFKTPERRNNTAEKLLQNNSPVLKQVCLSTFEEVTTDPFGAIWIRPYDYREVTKETPFAPERQISKSVYRRKSERDKFIESRIQKLRILTDHSRD